jgi:nitrogen fixation-related uncharacterized protein
MNVITILAVVALLAVMATLVWGVGSMAHGGSYDDEHSEKIMFTRVGIQALAFALIVLVLYFSLPD